MMKNIIEHILKQRQNNFLFLIMAISIIKCLVLFFAIEIILTPNSPIGYFPDATMYERITDNVLAGKGFSVSTASPFKPTMQKEPLYPFFIALIKLFPQYSINFVVFIQILLSPFIALLIYLIGKEIFTEKIARLSALLIALIPIYGEMSFFIMPELLFTLLLCTAVLCLLKAQNSINLFWFILAGMLLGFSTLCRNVALPLLFIYPITILLSKNKENIKRKSLVLKLAVFMFSFAVVITPWMYRNYTKLGLFSISRRGGGILSHQAYYAANFSQEEWKAYSLYLLSGRLAQKLYPKIIGNNLGDYEYAYLAQTSYVDGLLEKYPEGKVERILTHEAINNIVHHPVKYLLLSTIVYIQTFKYFESIPLMLNRGHGFIVMSLIRLALFIIGIAYTFITFLGILYGRRLFKYHLILVTIAYFHIILTSVGIIPGSLQRHILPITVFYSFFAVIAIDKIIHKWQAVRFFWYSRRTIGGGIGK